MPRYLIVNADDFGLTDGVNRGIIEGIERGIVTSASLMARQPAAAAAAAFGRQCDKFSLGLHLDLGEWIYRNNEWVQRYSVVDVNNATAISAEVSRQLAEFHRLAGRHPTHLDSHQHAHRKEPVRSIVLDAAHRLGVPVRDCTPGIRYCGDFYGQSTEGQPLPELLTVANLKKILNELPEGITELGCHPGYGEGLDSVYRAEREAELKVFCAPETRQTLKSMDIKLCSFNTLP
jgi:predicted glycoside hydrolase/deacetylase ChbG (UPF0249 family)